MDILYKLPFPQEVCSKIFTFACKSPHNGLGGAILKNKLQVMDLDISNPKSCLKSFKSNNFLGFLVFTNILINKIIS